MKTKNKYSLEEVSDFKSESEFMDAYVELHKQVMELLFYVVKLQFCDSNGKPKEISKDEAIIGGNFTRLIKLNTSLLQNFCQLKTEICFIVSRCAAETIINLMYFISEKNPNVLRNYIKNSLITEKELLNIINDNISTRNGEVLEIENRMRISIEKSFKDSNFELDEVNKSSKWKSVAQRAKSVLNEDFYSIFYGISSHSIHGNWQDILFNNLETTNNDKFKINMEWTRPRPQLLESNLVLNLSLLKLYFDKEIKPNNPEILGQIKNLTKYHDLLSNKHETFLSE